MRDILTIVVSRLLPYLPLFFFSSFFFSLPLSVNCSSSAAHLRGVVSLSPRRHSFDYFINLWRNFCGKMIMACRSSYRLWSSTFRIFMRRVHDGFVGCCEVKNTCNRVLLFPAYKSYRIFSWIFVCNRLSLAYIITIIHGLPLWDANSIPQSVFIVHHFGSCQFTAGAFSLRE